MSKEKQPEPEYEPKEKIQGKCWSCEHNVRSSMANTRNYIYVKEPWHSQTRLQCLDEACGATTILYHDRINEKSLSVALQYPTTILEFLDDDEDWENLMEVRAQAVGAHDIEVHSLNKRAEDMVAKWGEFLQRIIVDETDFS